MVHRLLIVGVVNRLVLGADATFEAGEAGPLRARLPRELR
jgi:hypothetical protein